MVVGLALVTFASVELPFFTKPNVFISLFETNGYSYKENHQFSLSVRAGENRLVWFFMVNMGFHLLKNCTVILYFPKTFKPLDDPELYEKLDFKKKFSIQKKYWGFFFRL